MWFIDTENFAQVLEKIKGRRASNRIDSASPPNNLEVRF
jgi:hypothetical protein